MKRRYATLLVGLTLSGAMMAQMAMDNMVTNAGFEELAGTVTTWNQLDKATGWTNANGGSVDVFSKGACYVGIPDNDLGNAEPFEGEHYAGFVAWKDDKRPNRKRLWKGTEAPVKPAWNQYSEYLQAQLSAPLVAGKRYSVKFHVSAGDNNDRAVSGIGALFSATMINQGKRSFIVDNPQVYTKDVIKEKGGWAEISGTFTATGNEQYVIFGAFPGAEMQKENVTEGADNQRAYYYIDGIEVTKAMDDADGDGIADGEDRCKDQPGPASTGGCPDGDGDGVADASDLCPQTAGTAEMKGCPDSDGDSVHDGDDKCPTVAGIAANKGCPEIKAETKAVFAKALRGIKFETGKSTIRSSSYGILDDVVSVMKDNDSYNLDIHGYTDSQGKDENNLKLSKSRAAAVKKYLEDKGVGGNRLASEGFGEAKPVADNGTSAGRAQNRRVEFKVRF